MDYSTEWSTANASRRFPLAEVGPDQLAELSGAEESWARTFIADLRLYLSPYESPEVFLKSVALNVGEDTYTLTFAEQATGDVLFSGDAAIEPSAFGASRSIADSNKVLVFSPGESWADFASIGLSGGGSVSFDSPQNRRDAMLVHPTRVDPGISGFKGFYLAAPWYDSLGALQGSDETVPGDGEDPPFAFNKVVAGYNIELSGDASTGEMSVGLLAASGEGLYPCQTGGDCKPTVKSISGVSPSATGNISLELIDCLRHSAIPSGGSESGIKIYSDCLPCCTCEDYNAVGMAISRQSAKLKDINDDIIGVADGAQEAYDDAVANLNARAPSTAFAESIRVGPDSVCVIVANQSSQPAYVGMSIELPPSWEISAGQPHVQAGLSLTGLPGLVTTAQCTGITDVLDVGGWTSYNTDLTIGQGGSMAPIPSGEIARVCFSNPNLTAKLDALALICGNLQAYLGGDDGEVLMDADVSDPLPTYPDDLHTVTKYGDVLLMMDALEATPMVDAGCTNDTTFPVDSEEEYKCRIQSAAEERVRADLRDRLLARKLRLSFIGDPGPIQIGGVDVATADMVDLIDDLEALRGMVDVTKRDGSYTAPAPLAWTVGGLPAWASASPSSGTGNGGTAITLEENTGPSSRTASLTFSGGSPVVITQYGTDDPDATTTEAGFNQTASRGSRKAWWGDHTIGVESSVSWTVGSMPAWLSATPTSGSEPAAVTFTFEENTGAGSRSATVDIGGTPYTAVQAGTDEDLVMSPPAYNAPSAGGSYTVEVSGDRNFTSDADTAEAIAQFRAQDQARSQVYARFSEVVADQLSAIDDALEAELGSGMAVDELATSLDMSVVSIFGDCEGSTANLSCSAFGHSFRVGRGTSGTGYNCVEKITALLHLSTEYEPPA